MSYLSNARSHPLAWEHVARFRRLCVDERKAWRDYRARAADTGRRQCTILICGPITDDTAGMVNDRLSDAAHATEISIHLDTPGGSGLAAEEIYAILRGHGASVRVYARGQVSSAGITVLAAGDERIADPLCRFLIHSPRNRFCDLDGDPDEALGDIYGAMLVQAKITGLSCEKFDALLAKGNRAECFLPRFDAGEALGCGLLTAIDRYRPRRTEPQVTVNRADVWEMARRQAAAGVVVNVSDAMLRTATRQQLLTIYPKSYVDFLMRGRGA